MAEEEQLSSMKAQVYKDPRPKEYFDRFHERARKRNPDPMYEIVRSVVTVIAYLFFRMRPIASELVPASGPVILAPNHFSFFDHFFLGAALRRQVRFMAKSQLFKAPMQFIYRHGGVFPVRRGLRDEEAFITAETILGRGGTIAMYCEGGRSRTGKLSDEAKPGIGRLALETGAAIVPVAIYGSAKVRNWKKLQFPKVTVMYGTPFRFEMLEDPTREQQQAVADQIFAEIKALYGQLEVEGRKAAVKRWRVERREAAPRSDSLTPLDIGVIATSGKPGERRLPLHPGHLERLSADVRGRLYLETGYGEPFGYSDERLTALVAGLRSRQALLTGSGIVVLPKPQHEDVAQMGEGQVLWGWPHCVQDPELTQLAIDRRLTVAAWEAMNHWNSDGSFSVHVFHKNNELAGYCSVLHALTLRGRSGAFGPRVRAAVISFGATGRGAVHGLSALGVSDVTVFTQREASAVASPITSVRIRTFDRDDDVAPALAKFDIVVNCIFQDPEAPLIFVRDEDLGLFEPGTLFVDVSCDEGMGFEWARSTSFAEPMLVVGDRCHYYAVDHSPSYLWNSATWEISEALVPYVPKMLSGPAAWEADETLHRAIEIRDGVVQNPKILAFQHRAPEYPHLQ